MLWWRVPWENLTPVNSDGDGSNTIIQFHNILLWKNGSSHFPIALMLCCLWHRCNQELWKAIPSVLPSVARRVACFSWGPSEMTSQPASTSTITWMLQGSSQVTCISEKKQINLAAWERKRKKHWTPNTRTSLFCHPENVIPQAAFNFALNV